MVSEHTLQGTSNSIRILMSSSFPAGRGSKLSMMLTLVASYIVCLSCSASSIRFYASMANPVAYDLVNLCGTLLAISIAGCDSLSTAS